MKHRLTFAEAKLYIEETQKFVPADYAVRFTLWLLDQMSFDDDGVTLWIPDTAPDPFITYH